MLNLCKHRSQGVRAVATRLLWNCIVTDEQNRDVVLGQDGMNILLQLLSDGNEEVQANAAGGALSGRVIACVPCLMHGWLTSPFCRALSGSDGESHAATATW